MRPEHLKTAKQLAENKPHGTRIKYMGGCKCALCRKANSRYECECAAMRRKGFYNNIVPARTAQRRLLYLSRKGIGRRTVSEITEISHSLLQKIKQGKHKRIRENTERRILAIRPEHAWGHCIIDAAPTWKLINCLIKEGFTEASLALRLGYKTPVLQINKNRIIAKNARKIRQFYDMIMAI